MYIEYTIVGIYRSDDLAVKQSAQPFGFTFEPRYIYFGLGNQIVSVTLVPKNATWSIL